jgi:hypothetical protein
VTDFASGGGGGSSKVIGGRLEDGTYAGQGIAKGETEAVNFTNEKWSNKADVDSGADTITVQKAGLYHVTGSVNAQQYPNGADLFLRIEDGSFPPQAYTQNVLQTTKNGETGAVPTVSTLAELDAGTPVSLTVYMNEGNVTIESSEQSTFLELVRLGEKP